MLHSYDHYLKCCHCHCHHHHYLQSPLFTITTIYNHHYHHHIDLLCNVRELCLHAVARLGEYLKGHICYVVLTHLQHGDQLLVGLLGAEASRIHQGQDLWEGLAGGGWWARQRRRKRRRSRRRRIRRRRGEEGKGGKGEEEGDDHYLDNSTSILTPSHNKQVLHSLVAHY